MAVRVERVMEIHLIPSSQDSGVKMSKGLKFRRGEVFWVRSKVAMPKGWELQDGLRFMVTRHVNNSGKKSFSAEGLDVRGVNSNKDNKSPRRAIKQAVNGAISRLEEPTEGDPKVVGEPSARVYEELSEYFKPSR